MAPFIINVTGRAEIPHPAERALIHVSVASSGINKAAVSDEVLTTARHIEGLLRQLSPQEDTPEAKQAAALAHWSKTSVRKLMGRTLCPRYLRRCSHCIACPGLRPTQFPEFATTADPSSLPF